MWDSLEDAFKELDKNEFMEFATSLAAYKDALMSKGFTRREACRLVENYAKFVYEWAIEDAVSRREQKLFNHLQDDEDQNE